MSAVPADDRGLLLGDGLFETVLFDQGRLVLWAEHVARLKRGCAALGYPIPDADGLAEQAAQAIQAAGLERVRAAVRVTWTAGSGGRGLDRPEDLQPRSIVSAAASPRPLDPVTLITATVRRNAASPASRLKTTSYLDNVLARREARARGAEEALMLNGQGDVACAAAANLFWISPSGLHTPALDCGVLDGILRAEVLAAAARLGVPAVETHAPSEALQDAKAMFITNSLIGVRRVGRWNDRDYDGHPLIDALENALTGMA